MKGRGSPAASFNPSLFLRQLEEARRVRSLSMSKTKSPTPRKASADKNTDAPMHVENAPLCLKEYIAEMVKMHVQELALSDVSPIHDARVGQLLACQENMKVQLQSLNSRLVDSETSATLAAQWRDELTSRLKNTQETIATLQESLSHADAKLSAIAARQGGEEVRSQVEWDKWTSTVLQLQSSLASHLDNYEAMKKQVPNISVAAGHSTVVDSLQDNVKQMEFKMLKATESLRIIQDQMMELENWKLEVARQQQIDQRQAARDREYERQSVRRNALQRRRLFGIQEEDERDEAAPVESYVEISVFDELKERVSALQDKLDTLQADVKPARHDRTASKQPSESPAKSTLSLERGLAALQQQMAKLESMQRAGESLGNQIDNLKSSMEMHSQSQVEVKGAMLGIGKRLSAVETFIADMKEALAAVKNEAEKERLERKQADLKMDGLLQRIHHVGEEMARWTTRLNTIHERLGALHTTVRLLAVLEKHPNGDDIADQLHKEEQELAEAREQQNRLHQQMIAQHAMEQQKYLTLLEKNQKQLEALLRVHEEEAAERSRLRLEAPVAQVQEKVSKDHGAGQAHWSSFSSDPHDPQKESYAIEGEEEDTWDGPAGGPPAQAVAAAAPEKYSSKPNHSFRVASPEGSSPSPSSDRKASLHMAVPKTELSPVAVPSSHHPAKVPESPISPADGTPTQTRLARLQMALGENLSERWDTSTDGDDATGELPLSEHGRSHSSFQHDSAVASSHHVTTPHYQSFKAKATKAPYALDDSGSDITLNSDDESDG